MTDEDDQGRNAPGEPGRKLAREAGDPERLLAGEDPDTRYVDDARHWVAVYRELLDFKLRVLGVTRDTLHKLTDSAREELLDTDLPILEAEAERFRRRIAFWEARVAELGG